MKLDPWSDYGKGRKPLRSFKELCEELNTAEAKMRGLLRKNPGIKPKYRSTGTVRNTWYDPEEFRRWFASVQK